MARFFRYLVVVVAILVMSHSQVSLTQDLPETRNSESRLTLAIVRDGPSRTMDELILKFKEEVHKLLGEEKEIVFKESGLDAQWNPQAASEVLRTALNDPEVDMIFAAGILVTQAAINPLLFLNKPVVGGLIQRSEVLDLPIATSGKSRKKNLTFASVNLSMVQDLKTFQEMVGFQRLALVVDQIAIRNLEKIQYRLHELEKSLQITIDLVPGATTAASILGQLEDAQAVMLTSMPRMSDAEHQALIDGINKRRLPSFSLFGYADVEKGVLAGLTPDLTERAARRAALDFQQILQNFEPTDLSVLMPVDSRLLINARTARQIGYSPSFLVLRSANFIHGDLLQQGESVNLDEAMRLAGENNINLSISEANVELSKQESLIRRSSLFPQADGSIRYNQIDNDRSIGSQGIIPERRTSANLDASQMIYDDSVVSRFRSSQKNLESTRLQHQSVRYDAMQTGGLRFADLLASLALFRIETENLRLTQNNLEMARIKFDVGMTGHDEVYRWEAQEAQQRGAVYERWSAVRQNLVALNQALNMPQDKEWKPQDITPEKLDRYIFQGKLRDLLDNVERYARLQNFLVQEAIKNSPNLQGVQKQVEGQKIELGQRQRQFYLPRFNTDFAYGRELQATRPGETVSHGDDNYWLFGAQATLPLLEGGRRIHEVHQVKADLMRLTSEQTRSAQLIEQQTRSALYAAVSSRENIYFTKEAAEKAKLNLNIVQDKYAQGTIGILSLIDAQSEYITRGQQAALAIYQHLANLIDIQRAISWFLADKTTEEKEQWFQEIKKSLP